MNAVHQAGVPEQVCPHAVLTENRKCKPMKRFAALSLALALAGCTAVSGEVQPIPGSITYGAGPSTRLTKSPVGSQVLHRLRDQFGKEWEELYIVQPDGSLKLVSRRRYPAPTL